jgi:hypothetical protein
MHAIAPRGRKRAHGGDQVVAAAWRGRGANDDDGWTPLHLAAFNGHVEAIGALELLGADKEAKSARGETPLYLAAGKGHVEAIKVERSSCWRRWARR